MSNYKCQTCQNVFDESFTTASRRVPSPDNLSCPCCGSNVLERAHNEELTVGVLDPHEYDWIDDIESPLMMTSETPVI